MGPRRTPNRSWDPPRNRSEPETPVSGVLWFIEQTFELLSKNFDSDSELGTQNTQDTRHKIEDRRSTHHETHKKTH